MFQRALRRLASRDNKCPTRGKADYFAEALVSQNRTWRDRKLKEDTTYFSKVGGPQKPKCIWIGCSDSRVPAEKLSNVAPGEFFVHRNVANMVVSTDANLISVLQYGLIGLQIPNIVVCGHYDCGGIRAALDVSTRTGTLQGTCPLENWLSHIRDVYRTHKGELDELQDDARYRRLIELNVLEQCLNIFKLPFVQEMRAKRRKEGTVGLPRIHAMVYEVETGILNRLPIHFKHYQQEFNDVYGIYDEEEGGGPKSS